LGRISQTPGDADTTLDELLASREPHPVCHSTRSDRADRDIPAKSASSPVQVRVVDGMRRRTPHDPTGEVVTAAYDAGQRGDTAASVVDIVAASIDGHTGQRRNRRGVSAKEAERQLVQAALDGWQLGWMAASARVAAVDGLTGLTSPAAFTSHLRLLYERAAWFDMPPSSMAAIVTCGRRDAAMAAEGIDGLAIALATTAALRDVMPPGTPCARLGNGRLAALVPLDEGFGPTMARLLATLHAADPELTAEIVSLPAVDDLDHVLAALI
jgi:hypothetical protein